MVGQGQCDQIWLFSKELFDYFPYLSSPTVWQKFWLFWITGILSKKLLWLLFGQLLEKLVYFLFQHLVTLVQS